MSVEILLPLVYIIGFFVLIMLFDSSINYLMQNSFVGPKYRLFVAPGIIIHELSHALAALITFHKVKKINIFDPDGGYVIHEKTREPLSQVAISFAPIIGISFSFLVFTYLLMPGWLSSQNNYSLSSIWGLITATSFARWQTWLYIYLVTSLATSLAPSTQDFKVASSGIILIIIILLLLSISSLHNSLISALQHTYIIAIFILIFLCLALLLSLIFYSITKLTLNKRG